MDALDLPEDARLVLTRSQLEKMIAEICQHATEETCGILGGVWPYVFKVYSITNVLHSAILFRMDATEQLKAMLEIEHNGWDILAIYHSHLNGSCTPSETDIKEFMYPGVIYLIFSILDNDLLYRGFRIFADGWTEIPVVIEG